MDSDHLSEAEKGANALLQMSQSERDGESSDQLSEDEEAATILVRMARSHVKPRRPTSNHHANLVGTSRRRKGDEWCKLVETARRWANIEKILKGTDTYTQRLDAGFWRVRSRARLCWIGFWGKQDGRGILQAPQWSNERQPASLDRLSWGSEHLFPWISSSCGDWVLRRRPMVLQESNAICTCHLGSLRLYTTMFFFRNRITTVAPSTPIACHRYPALHVR